MNETQKRIKAYQDALPALRERVVAVALLLVMSLSMVASASFAWLTISKAPAVSGIDTTVAANGNLEIALVSSEVDEETKKAIEPGTSRVGDSFAAEGQSIVNANLTWGNLINLTDPSYGLDQMALRPALLSDYNLNKYPLYGASYGKDGRVITTSDRYEYATWSTANDGTKYFSVNTIEDPNYGVRAISSVKYENITGNATFIELFGRVLNAYTNASDLYVEMLTDEQERKYIAALEGLMTVFVQDIIDNMFGSGGEEKASNCGPHVPVLYKMIMEFQDVLAFEGEALLNMANLQAYLNPNGEGKTNTYADLADLLNDTSTELKTKGVKVESLTTYRENLTELAECIAQIGPYAAAVEADPATVVVWDDISVSINKIVDISTATLNGVKIADLGADDAGFLYDALRSNNNQAVIHAGILKDFEQRIGTCMGRQEDMNNKEIKVSLVVDASAVVNKVVNGLGGLFKEVSVSAYISTSAASPFTSTTDKAYTESMNSGFASGDAVAKDVYGMAIDLWVRTNASNTVLKLEGSLVTENVPDDTGRDKNGNPTTLYVIKADGLDTAVYLLEDVWYYHSSHTAVEEEVLADENNAKTTTDSSGATVDLYYLLVDGANREVYQSGSVWYYDSNRAVVPSAALSGSTPTRFPIKLVEKVIGYQGENRIWEEWESMLENDLIAENNTTQGAGSCYVFYAEGASEQEKLLEMLNAFTVAFVDEEGNRLAVATLATDHAYEINGKVTVPLEIVNGVEYEDEDGNTQLGIMNMQLNTPMRLSAIVYLNGMRLTNENVLAANEIEGQLNLQFGSSVELNASTDTPLQNEYRTITASASAVVGDETVTSTGETSPITYTYDKAAKSVTVTLTVDGQQPSRIEGFFTRAINATQGSRGEKKTFNKQEDGTWTATFDLTTPGTYKLNSVFVDGVEYELEDHPAVLINGFDIASVSSSRSGVVMTGDDYIETEVTVRFNGSPDLLPSRVRAQFRSSDGKKEYNATLTYAPNQTGDSNTWTGTVRINSSGSYTLEYLILDGEEKEIPQALQKSIIAYLGMTTRIYNVDSTALNFAFMGSRSIPVRAEIWDDSNTEMKALGGVNLYYHSDVSSLDQDGMYAELEWNSSGGYYEGTLELEWPGNFLFDRLTVRNGESTSTIRKALAAPTYSAVSLQPPSYMANTTAAYQFVPNSRGAFTVQLADSSTAKVYALLEDQNGNARTVAGSAGMIDDSEEHRLDRKWTFTIPEEGDWELKELYLQNVYAGGAWHSDTYVNVDEGESPVTPDRTNSFVMTPTDGPVTAYVVSNVNVTLKTVSGQATTFGSTDNGVTRTAGFMSEHQIGGLEVVVQDWNGQAIENLTGMSLQYTLDKTTMETYGGYTTTANINASAVWDADPSTLTSADGKNFRTVGTKSIAHAGEYKCYALSFSVGTHRFSYGTAPETGITNTNTAINAPVFKVWSKVPTVLITDITPDGSPYSVDETTSGVLKDTIIKESVRDVWLGSYKTYTMGTSNKHIWAEDNVKYLSGIYDANGIATDVGVTADLYFKCAHESVKEYSGGEKWGALGSYGDPDYKPHKYNYSNGNGVPSATITLSNTGNLFNAIGSTATLKFTPKKADDSVRMFTTYEKDSGWGEEENKYWTHMGEGSSTQTDSYVWSKEEGVKRFIGYMDQDSNGDQKQPAGTLTANSLVVVYNGATYTFAIPTITINNEY